MIATIVSLEDTIAEIIGSRSGKDKEEVKATYFDGAEHWLKAEEALALGLIDAIYDVAAVPDESTTDDIYRIFTNRLELEQQPQNLDKMKLEDFRKIPRFANCTDEAAVMTMLGETAEKADKADDLEKENGQLKEQVQQQNEERIETAVTDAVADGRIGADQKDTYKNILKADFKNGMIALKGLKPKKMLKDKLENLEPQGEGAWEKRQREIRESAKK